MNKAFSISTDLFHLAYYPDELFGAKSTLEINQRGRQECHEIPMDIDELRSLQEFLSYVISEADLRKEDKPATHLSSNQ